LGKITDELASRWILFFAGVFLTNGIPHVVSGVMGRPFQTPLAGDDQPSRKAGRRRRPAARTAQRAVPTQGQGQLAFKTRSAPPPVIFSRPGRPPAAVKILVFSWHALVVNHFAILA
jgi:hypothetical protein